MCCPVNSDILHRRCESDQHLTRDRISGYLRPVVRQSGSHEQRGRVVFTSTAVALPLKKRALRGRRLVVVDIENVVGGAVLTTEQAVGAHLSINEVAALNGSEHVVIGTSHVGVVSTGLGWRGPRLVVRSGEN